MEIISKVMVIMVISTLLQLSLEDKFKCKNHQLSINCGAFKITKTERHYKIQLCTSNDEDPCTMGQNFIDCNNICKVCAQLLEVDHNEDLVCNEKWMCEKQVDNFLLWNCSNLTTSQRTTCPPPTQEPATSRVPHTEEIIMTVSSLGNINTKLHSYSNQTMEVCSKVPATILGVLMGLLTLILVVVTTGWAWTCWTMKKQSNRTKLCTQRQGCKDKRSYPNPTYGMSTDSQPAAVAGTARQLHSQEEGNRQQTHNVINRADNQQHQEMNEMEGGGSGENHMYHVLEKPRDDDYEDPDKDMEENTAMEYEIPLPLKEI